MTMVSRCKGCDWTTEFTLDDPHSYIAAAQARNEHVASCLAYAAKARECRDWIALANAGGVVLLLEDYERHREFDPFLPTKVDNGVLEILLDTALDTIAKMGEAAFRE